MQKHPLTEKGSMIFVPNRHELRVGNDMTSVLLPPAMTSYETAIAQKHFEGSVLRTVDGVSQMRQLGIDEEPIKMSSENEQSGLK